MSPKGFLLDDRLHAYLLAHAAPLDDVAQGLIDETAALGDVARMQISPDQGAFIALLTGALGVRNAVEIGIRATSPSAAVSSIRPCATSSSGAACASR